MICPDCPGIYNIILTGVYLLSVTFDVKRNIFDLCTDSSDCFLAVIEVRILKLHC